MPTVRAAQPADLAQLVAIYNYYVQHSTATFDIEPISVQDRRAWFATFSSVALHRKFGFTEVGVFGEYAKKTVPTLVRCGCNAAWNY